MSVADPNRLRAVIKWFGENYTKNQGLSEKGRMGTMLGVVPMSEMGLLPTRNFREGSFSLAEEIGGENLHATLVGAREGCRACPVRCKRVVTGEQLDKRYGGPEFESIGSLGSNCCIGDPNALVKANELCNSLGLDTISTGVTIAFAMECFEARILTYDDTDGENIRFGNASAMLQLIEMIGLRRGIGGLLAEGSLRAAEKLGRGSERFSMSVKGQELPAHDPRGKWAVALGYAVSPTGADHLQAAHDTWFERDPHPEIPYGFVDVSDLWPFGIYEPMEATSLDAKKVRAFAVLQRWWSLHNVLDLCIFVSTPEYRMTGLDRLVEITHAVTGWNVTDSELLRAGELGITLARMFNYREGFSRADDRLPERLYEDLPYCHGSHPGISRDEFSSALSLYYSLMGWDAEGQPHEWKKIELGLANCCSDYTKREEA